MLRGRCELVHNGVRAGAVPPQASRDSRRAARTGSGDRTRDRSCSQSCGARVIPRKRASRRGRIVACCCTVALGRGPRQDRHVRDQDREIGHAIGGRDPDPSGANPFGCPRTAIPVRCPSSVVRAARRSVDEVRADLGGRLDQDAVLPAGVLEPRPQVRGANNQHQRDKEYLDPHVILWPCPDTMDLSRYRATSAHQRLPCAACLPRVLTAQRALRGGPRRN
jgi:hypothetical protein